MNKISSSFPPRCQCRGTQWDTMKANAFTCPFFLCLNPCSFTQHAASPQLQRTLNLSYRLATFVVDGFVQFKWTQYMSTLALIRNVIPALCKPCKLLLILLFC